MSGPTVFISYSHQDETWKDQLVRQLKVLELEGSFDLWDDRKIAAGAGWRAEIETAMARAKAAVLLISADFLIPISSAARRCPASSRAVRTTGSGSSR
jgi:hypothetical protein